MIQSAPEKEFCTKREYADEIDVCERTLGEWMRNEGFPFVKIGTAQNSPVRIHRPSAREWLLKRQQNLAGASA